MNQRAEEPRTLGADAVRVLGVRYDKATLAEAVGILGRFVEERRARYLCTPNGTM